MIYTVRQNRNRKQTDTVHKPDRKESKKRIVMTMMVILCKQSTRIENTADHRMIRRIRLRTSASVLTLCLVWHEVMRKQRRKLAECKEEGRDTYENRAGGGKTIDVDTERITDQTIKTGENTSTQGN